MFNSPILEEKYKTQMSLAKKANSIDEYIKNTHQSALQICKEYGCKIKYANIKNSSHGTGGRKNAVISNT